MARPLPARAVPRAFPATPTCQRTTSRSLISAWSTHPVAASLIAMVFSIFAGGPNTIKEQQIAFQALKKKTGNTFTAKAMPLNIAAVFTIIIGGFILVPMNVYSIANGKNKIKLN
ncbi:hypothetical protein Ctob_013702 [Chrysochromulina tobinii]|uniref:Uncharacterized protein n=1 Tax=Chrysochromulina tobinii TaxID=1460289 RepID=A0A0M0K1H8_9EUKA|nr:hypothetical protein Ctob_013702 [Chrysochromulina tobinii]|eukprot:KOO32736.1 hypothetical protein Ctob_013702 [Chrysochromulina sp. CCMP291]